MNSALVRVVSVALACGLAVPASGELLARKDLSLATALTIATTAAEACKAQGQRVSVTVVVTTAESPGGAKDEACVKAGLDKVADQLK